MLFRKKELTAAEQMINYMKEKYQEDFTPSSCEEANWAYSYDSMVVSFDKFPGEYIDVYRYEKKIFKDNYMSFLFREEIENLVHDIAEPLFGKCKVTMQLSHFPAEGNLKKGASLEEYLKNAPPDNGVTIYIKEFNPSKDYTECVEQLRLQFKKYMLPHLVDLFFIKSDKSFEEISRKTEYDILCLSHIDEDTWLIKEAHCCFLGNYELSESGWRQLWVD